MLTEEQIQNVAARVADRGVDKFGTQLVRQAAAAVDAWIADNQADMNLALPVEFRTNASLQEKSLLFAYVALKRAGII